MASAVRTNVPQNGEEADEVCTYISNYLREKQWGFCVVYLQWNEKRQQLEATVYHKMPVWRYKFSNMERIGGQSYSIERTENDVWMEGYLTKAKIGNEYRPSKGSWIRNYRTDFELDANGTKELWAAQIDKELDEFFSEEGASLGEYFHGPREKPYPAPKMSTVDWDWNED